MADSSLGDDPDPRIGAWVPMMAAPVEAPRWLRGEFKVPVARRKEVHSGQLRLEGVTRGRVKVNGIELGGYALREPGGRTARGTASIELPIPANAFLGEGPIELLLFDEAGADPSRVTIELLIRSQIHQPWLGTIRHGDGLHR